VWSRIVTELAVLQDDSSGIPGSVVNPVYGRPYVVDTCCAAAVFVAEHRRTGAVAWRARADAALAAARSDGLFSGVSEPLWVGPGWRETARSLAATGIAVDAYCAAEQQLARTLAPDETRALLDLVASCRTISNGFTHDALDETAPTPDVQNATASALNIMGLVSRVDGASAHPVYTGIDATLARLGGGQTTAGFWPYFYPGRKLRLKEALGRRVPHGRHGDLTHHLMALYFAAGYAASRPPTVANPMLSSGWQWVRTRLLADGGRLSIDWSEDPAPSRPQHTNARDTNAYFLILGTLPRLEALGVVEDVDTTMVAEALLDHIASALLAEPGENPCVTPHEGPSEVVGNMLPMFEQSAAWKGRLLAESI